MNLLKTSLVAPAVLVALLFAGCGKRAAPTAPPPTVTVVQPVARDVDRKSTRLNSSHSQISYAVFCLKKKKIIQDRLVPKTGFTSTDSLWKVLYHIWTEPNTPCVPYNWLVVHGMPQAHPIRLRLEAPK